MPKCSVTQLCLTLSNPVDCSPPGSSVHGIISKNTGVGCHFLLQGDLPDPGVEPASPEAPALAGRFCTTESLGKQENEEHRKADEFRDIPGSPVVNNQPYNVKDMGLIPGGLGSHMPQDN